MNHWDLFGEEVAELDSSPVIMTCQSAYIKDDDVLTLILWILKKLWFNL